MRNVTRHLQKALSDASKISEVPQGKSFGEAIEKNASRLRHAPPHASSACSATAWSDQYAQILLGQFPDWTQGTCLTAPPRVCKSGLYSVSRVTPVAHRSGLPEASWKRDTRSRGDREFNAERVKCAIGNTPHSRSKADVIAYAIGSYRSEWAAEMSCFPYCRNLTVASLEQVMVPASHT